MYSAKQQKYQGTKTTQSLSNQMPHKVGEIDKGVHGEGCVDRKCAVAVQCIGCRINGQIMMSLLLLSTNGHNV